MMINWYNFAGYILKSIEVKDESRLDYELIQFIKEFASDIEAGDTIKIEEIE